MLLYARSHHVSYITSWIFRRSYKHEYTNGDSLETSYIWAVMVYLQEGPIDERIWIGTDRGILELPRAS